jgi:hypothetical protein
MPVLESFGGRKLWETHCSMMMCEHTSTIIIWQLAAWLRSRQLLSVNKRSDGWAIRAKMAEAREVSGQARGWCERNPQVKEDLEKCCFLVFWASGQESAQTKSRREHSLRQERIQVPPVQWRSPPQKWGQPAISHEYLPSASLCWHAWLVHPTALEDKWGH